MNCRLAAVLAIKADQRIDLEVCEVEIDIYGVKANEEVYKSLLLRGRNVRKEGGSNGLLDSRRWSAGEGRRKERVRKREKSVFNLQRHFGLFMSNIIVILVKI